MAKMAITPTMAALLFLVAGQVIGALTPMTYKHLLESDATTSNIATVRGARSVAQRGGALTGAGVGFAAWFTGTLDIAGSAVLAMCAMNATYLVLAAGEYVEGKACDCDSVNEWLLGFYRASSRNDTMATIIVALTVLALDR
jgi:hypothetical protein